MSADDSEYERKRRLLEKWEDREREGLRRGMISRVITVGADLSGLTDMVSDAASEAIDRVQEKDE